MYLSSVEISQLSTDEVSFDCLEDSRGRNRSIRIVTIATVEGGVGAENVPGKCWHRKAYAMRSADCPFRSRRTICHRRRTATTARSSRADAADTCPASWRAVPPRASSPFRPLTIRLCLDGKETCVETEPTGAAHCTPKLTRWTVAEGEDL